MLDLCKSQADVLLPSKVSLTRRDVCPLLVHLPPKQHIEYAERQLV